MNHSTLPPAWHPDPTGRNELRYWDGVKWTEHVANLGQQGADPLPTSASSGVEGVSSADAVLPATTTEDDKSIFGKLRDDRRSKATGRDDFERVAMAAATGDDAALSALPKALGEARTLY